jgi:hypothetical protein
VFAAPACGAIFVWVLPPLLDEFFTLRHYQMGQWRLLARKVAFVATRVDRREIFGAKHPSIGENDAIKARFWPPLSFKWQILSQK